jgi:hypothetical protein
VDLNSLFQHKPIRSSSRLKRDRSGSRVSLDYTTGWLLVSWSRVPGLQPGLTDGPSISSIPVRSTLVIIAKLPTSYRRSSYFGTDFIRLALFGALEILLGLTDPTISSQVSSLNHSILRLDADANPLHNFGHSCRGTLLSKRLSQLVSHFSFKSKSIILFVIGIEL